MPAAPLKLWRLDETRLLRQWGDYGSILCNGLVSSVPEDGPCRLQRTGPFVPPISIAFRRVVVVRDDIKARLERSGLRGVGGFRPLVLEKVVCIPWHEWDWEQPLDGPRLPFNGEPEEYIYHNPHDPETAAKLPPLWTWHPEQIGRVIRSPEGVVCLAGILQARRDVFRLRDKSYRAVLVNERGKHVLEDMVGDWLSFKPVQDEIAS